MTESTQENYAPLDDLQQAKKTVPAKKQTLLELVKGWREEMRREKNSEEWTRRYLASQKNEYFYKGFQQLRKSDLSNTYRPIEPKPIHYTLNEFAFWCNVNVMKWIASRSDYRISGLDDADNAEAAAAKLAQIVRFYDDRDWPRTRVIKASKQAQFEAHLVTYVYHDPTYENRKAFRPVMERAPVKLANDGYRCADCDEVGEIQPESAPVCEHCGSDRLAITEVPEFESEVAKGQKEINCGDVTDQDISIFNIVWNARQGLAKSSLVLWEEEYSADELESTYEGLELARSNAVDMALQRKSALQNAGTRSDGQGYILSRLWVEPSRYRNTELAVAIKPIRGEEIPAGTKLGQKFPEGCHIILQGDTIVDVYSAIKNDDLSVMEYHSVPNGLARGIDDMCEPQRQMNTVNSLINVWMRHNAAPPLTYVAGVVDPGDISGDLSRPIPIEAQNIALFDGVTVENALTYKQGQQIPAGVFTYGDRLRAAIQFAAHATEFSDGLPNTDNETLGGARIAQGLAQAISGIHLAQFADHRARVATLKLKKFREYCWDERYFQFSGDYGVLEGEYLTNTDIPEHFKIETVPNSWLPRLPEQKQQNFQALLAAVGGIAGLAATPPSLLAELCETYDVRLNDNMFPAALRLCRYRIKKAMELLPALQQAQSLLDGIGMQVSQPQAGAVPLPDGQIAPVEVQQPVSIAEQLFEAMQPPFNVRAEGHGIAAEFISKWLLTDPALEAPQEIIDFVGLLQDAHIQAEQLHQQVRAGVAASGAPPMPVEPGKPNPAAAQAPVGG